MKFESLLVALVIAGFLYISGYSQWANWIVILGIIVFVISNIFRKKPKAVPKGQVMQPIIIESTRGAPYRIPDEMDLWVKPKGKQGKPWWKNVTSSGIFATLGTKIGKTLGGGKKEEK